MWEAGPPLAPPVALAPCPSLCLPPTHSRVRTGSALEGPRALPAATHGRPQPPGSREQGGRPDSHPSGVLPSGETPTPPGRTSPISPRGQGQSAEEPKTRSGWRPGAQRRETALGLKGARGSPPTPGAPHPRACSTSAAPEVTCGGKGPLVDTWNHSASGRSLPDGALVSVPTWIRQVLVVLVEAGSPWTAAAGLRRPWCGRWSLAQADAGSSCSLHCQQVCGRCSRPRSQTLQLFLPHGRGKASPSLSSSTESPPHKDQAAAMLWVQWTAAASPPASGPRSPVGLSFSATAGQPSHVAGVRLSVSRATLTTLPKHRTRVKDSGK